MNKEEMNKYGYELMVKNNPEEAVKNLILKDKQINKAIEYINSNECCEEWEIDGNMVQDNILKILKGEE